MQAFKTTYILEMQIMCPLFIIYTISAITMSGSDRKHIYQFYSKLQVRDQKKSRNASSSRDTQHRLEMPILDRTSQGPVLHTLSILLLNWWCLGVLFPHYASKNWNNIKNQLICSISWIVLNLRLLKLLSVNIACPSDIFGSKQRTCT